MGKKLGTHKRDNDNYCEIHIDTKDEVLYVKYFENGRMSEKVEYPDKDLSSVRKLAENWCDNDSGALLLG